MKNRVVLSIVLVSTVLLIVASVMLLFNGGNGEKTLELSYKTNAGVPYKWEYEIEDPSVVELEKTYEVENKNKDGITGAPITTNYVFRGLKEGTTKVTFKYVSIIDSSVSKEDINLIKVDKNKNISLIVDFE